MFTICIPVYIQNNANTNTTLLDPYPFPVQFLKGCLGTLRAHAPDNIALGSCIFFYCVSACLVYKSSNPEEELFMKKCVGLLGECLDTDWCAVKDYNMMLCHFALGKCQQRLERHTDAIHHFTEAKKLVDEQDEVISYIYFRRAWSYKVIICIIIYIMPLQYNKIVSKNNIILF
jgi:hypothetical protein